ncbi:DNA alkylation repair protein [Naasia sp. SYSU D00948]|uniref:DNA alkylation repair protein n=1 Tax=Naasia sp. SYSU D00948 TaxID=2817379 RepID=UPI001B30F58A|nr:DNA alkylation repair protein [Naasia sp. SYSU D00948]
MTDLTAEAYLDVVREHQSAANREKIRRYYRGDAEPLGVRMKTVFDTAKAFERMPLDEVERLLDSGIYEGRVGAVSILDFKARQGRITDDERRDLYELYLRRHDRIDSWDLVDRAAPRVVGWYLADKSRAPLYELAASTDPWERRTAITAAFWFIRERDLDDALALAGILLHDPEELVNKSVGTALRDIGRVDRDRLVAFLEEHAATMPRVTLRYAIEHLPPEQRAALLAR